MLSWSSAPRRKATTAASPHTRSSLPTAAYVGSTSLPPWTGSRGLRISRIWGICCVGRQCNDQCQCGLRFCASLLLALRCGRTATIVRPSSDALLQWRLLLCAFAGAHGSDYPSLSPSTSNLSLFHPPAVAPTFFRPLHPSPQCGLETLGETVVLFRSGVNYTARSRGAAGERWGGWAARWGADSAVAAAADLGRRYLVLYCTTTQVLLTIDPLCVAKMTFFCFSAGR